MAVIDTKNNHKKKYLGIQCPCKFSTEMALVTWQKPCQPKIRNSSLEIVIKKDIARFYISMYDTHMELLM